MKLQELSLSDLYGLRESLMKRTPFEKWNDKLLQYILVVDGVIKELEDDLILNFEKE
jgi:hypothetical protein